MTIPAENPVSPKSSARPTWRFVVLAMAITLFGLLLQIRCLGPDYQKVIDDNQLIYSTGPEGDRGCSDNPTECFQHPVFGLYYRPLFTATFAARDQLFKIRRTDDPHYSTDRYFYARQTTWYHIENLALHGAVCGLSFWFFFLLFRKERPALLAGLVLTLHPLQVSVTTFIGGRPDSMALFFLLLFGIGAMNSTRITTPPWLGWARRRSYLMNVRVVSWPFSSLRCFLWFLISLFGYACAVFTKEQCALLLLILPLLYLRDAASPGYTEAAETLEAASEPAVEKEPGGVTLFSMQAWIGLLFHALYLVPAVFYVIAARKIMRMDTVPDPHWTKMLHLEMIGRTLAYFERLLLIPTVGPIHQSTLGPWDTPQPLVTFVGYLLAVLWIVLLIRTRRNSALRFCAFWTTLTLLPCLNLFPIPSQFASCYRAVIPLLGFAGLLGGALDRLFDRLLVGLSQSERLQYYLDYSFQTALVRQQGPGYIRHYGPAGILVLLLVAFYSWETVADVQTWKNNKVLMDAEIYGDPNFVPAYGGLAFWAEGSADRAADWKEAEKQFTIVLDRILPKVKPGQTFEQAIDSPACWRNLWSQAGLRYSPRTLNPDGKDYTGYFQVILPHRGWARQQQGHFSEAEADYRMALLVRPMDQNSRANLYNCYMANGKIEEATALYSNPGSVPARINSNR